MGIRFSFVVYGILAVFALVLVLAFTSEQIVESGSNLFTVAVFVVVFVFAYMLARLFKRGF